MIHNDTNLGFLGVIFLDFCVVSCFIIDVYDYVIGRFGWVGVSLVEYRYVDVNIGGINGLTAVVVSLQARGDGL